MKSITLAAGGALLLAGAFVLFVPTWEHFQGGTEVGFPQEIQFTPARTWLAVNKAPPPLPPAEVGGPLATAVYKNVQVLTDVSAAEFMRTQQAITNWVSPKEGCGFCHAGENYASDEKPAKAAARIMMQMTRHMNADWAVHVQPSGVTCYSCHRGQPVPSETWFPQAPMPEHPLVAKRDNWQESADTVRKFFPDAGWDEWFVQDQPARVQSTTALPTGRVSSFVVAKRLYEMMMQYSDGIGVNCGFCHNSRAFNDWSESTPYRWSGYNALRLVRDLNSNFLLKIAAAMPQTRQLMRETSLPVIPAQQRGVQEGNGLVVCATCHLGLPKPLNGANMVHDYPAMTTAPQANSTQADPSQADPSQTAAAR